MTTAIHSLSDDQLDSIAGGTALPSGFDKYAFQAGSRGTALRIGYATSGAGSAAASVQSGPASREFVESRLSRAEAAGATSITFFAGSDDRTGVSVSIADARAMLNSQA